ncbi:GTPase HflX [Lactonifactor longoviformis]|uniref:GTPase HflX n=2 Tax=Lactonifactor TaxID=420345 RepID=A0A1M5AWK9_9CLOT|nr:GTPase HflX [Lactonifactor longoviformis]POP32994.1 GTPase HflX [Lactonifactor longoviformis]SHF34477.1 GTP-binding protein HflX [Lactonifactor longoviformis DSM 17459]
MQLYDMSQIEERVILVGVQENDRENTEESLEELGELARTAGAQVAGTLIQNREAIHPVTYVGKGKLEELKGLVYALDATGIICDDELSAVQLRNLEQSLECKIMDRTLLILDIFAARATSSEGKIQVELAQLRYRAARLVGLRNSLSRLGGGIGTRGPGEKKLEMDRRLIHTRIGLLKRELEDVKQHRELIRKQRAKTHKKVAALVGYTSAGKSSMLNALTDAGIYEDEMLFSTLDTTTRALKLSGKQEILLTDTVGFIQKLPHHLIEAFKSTLEEARYADIIIHVVDASNPRMDTQMHVVYETLRQLQVENKLIVTLFNKQDRLCVPGGFRDFRADYSILTSSKTGQGLEELREVLAEILREGQIYIERLYPYEKAGLLQLIRQGGELLEEEYLPEGISVKAFVSKEIYPKI